MNPIISSLNSDPLRLAKLLWPNVQFYSKQVDIIRSIRDNKETYVVAGNQLGKDFVAGFIALAFFLVPHMFFDPKYVAAITNTGKGAEGGVGLRSWLVTHQRRVITTSVAQHHLNILWGEISRFIATSSQPLSTLNGGELVINHQEIRWRDEQLAKNPMNYLVGKVSGKEEGMAGHHAPYTLIIVDEASGVDDAVYKQAQGWAKKFLIFGNPNPCTNFFFRGVTEGDKE